MHKTATVTRARAAPPPKVTAAPGPFPSFSFDRPEATPGSLVRLVGVKGGGGAFVVDLMAGGGLVGATPAADKALGGDGRWSSSTSWRVDGIAGGGCCGGGEGRDTVIIVGAAGTSAIANPMKVPWLEVDATAVDNPAATDCADTIPAVWMSATTVMELEDTVSVMSAAVTPFPAAEAKFNL
eukprot:6958894-Prymnesium_polylepis.1